jgi:hypothetical protein
MMATPFQGEYRILRMKNVRSRMKLLSKWLRDAILLLTLAVAGGACQGASLTIDPSSAFL